MITIATTMAKNIRKIGVITPAINKALLMPLGRSGVSETVAIAVVVVNNESVKEYDIFSGAME